MCPITFIAGQFEIQMAAGCPFSVSRTFVLPLLTVSLLVRVLLYLVGISDLFSLSEIAFNEKISANIRLCQNDIEEIYTL